MSVEIKDSIKHKSFVQSYSLDGKLLWEISIDSQSIHSDLFVSALDGTLAIVCGQLIEEKPINNLLLINKNGVLMRKIPMYPFGDFERSYFHTINGKQYFLSASGGDLYYVIDTENGEIINNPIRGKENAIVSGVAISKQYFVSLYLTKNQKRPAAKEHGENIFAERILGLEDPDGKVVYVPLDLTGHFFLLATATGIYLREDNGSLQTHESKFYKLNLK